jgi:hypothetical protein
LGAIYAALAWWDTPRPLGVNAPPQSFSAGRAADVLKRLIGHDGPHPLGSDEGLRVRAQILDELARIGVRAEVHEGYGCAVRHASCGPVHNIVGRIAGSAAEKAVLLLAHQDSVPAGPGASDDGAGVAALIEIARVLSVGPARAHPIILLIDDGEEAGLLGAEAFAATDPWMAEVGAVVNVEARGTSGASRLFETSGPQRWLLQHAGRALPWPATSSIDTTVYEKLPNDTDLSVFKRRGIPGVNFAFIGDAARYHTPMDDLGHLSLGSLQHQGDNALAAVRALADADLDDTPSGRAVFFDLAHLRLVMWPEWLSLPLAAAGGLLLLITIVRLRPRPAAHIVIIRVVMAGVAMAVSYWIAREALRVGVWAGAFSSTWIAHPLPVLVMMWVLPFAVVIALLWLVNLFVDHPTNWVSVWALWAPQAILSARLIPGLSYLFIVPLLFAGLLGVLTIPANRWAVATIGPAVVAAFLWFPLLHVWYDALGTPLLPVLATFVSFLTTLLLPLLAAFDRERLGALFGNLSLALVGLVIICACVPPRSPDHPAPLTFRLHADADAHRSTWEVFTSETELPDAMVRAIRFRANPQAVAPREASFTADAGAMSFEAPVVQVLANVTEGSVHHLRLHVSSPRHAPLIEIGPQDGRWSGALRIADSTEAKLPDAGTERVTLWSVPDSGLDLELLLNEPVRQLAVRDVSFGLPPEGRSLLATRTPDFAPIHRGDTVVVSRVVGM